MDSGSKPVNVLAADVRENKRYVVPSEFVIRDCLVRVEPGTLDRALNLWNQAWGLQDSALAIDGKTMKLKFHRISYFPERQSSSHHTHERLCE